MTAQMIGAILLATATVTSRAGTAIAAERGAAEHQLMAINGGESPKQAALYTRKVNRKRLAGDAMRLIALPNVSNSATGSVQSDAKSLISLKQKR